MCEEILAYKKNTRFTCMKCTCSACFRSSKEWNMASCSRTFQEPKTAEEENKFLQSAIQKSTRSVTNWSVKISSEWQNGRRNKNPSLESIGYKTNASKVQELDTDMREMTAESLNFWLVRSVFNNCAFNFL